MGKNKLSKPIKDFAGIVFRKLKFLDKDFVSELQQRMNEAELCLAGRRPLPAIILYGSILEGALFKYAEYYPDKFNTAKSCPKEKGKPKKISKWTFAQFIKVSHEIGLLKSDTMKYVEILKNFDNYISIQKQVNCNVDFSEDTVNMCRATLVATIKNMKKASD